ncbi:MAG: hypothetical protein ACREDD_08540 [Methylocella sp.]
MSADNAPPERPKTLSATLSAMKQRQYDETHVSRAKGRPYAIRERQHDAAEHVSRTRPGSCQGGSLIQKPVIFKGSILFFETSENARIEASHNCLHNFP